MYGFLVFSDDLEVDSNSIEYTDSIYSRGIHFYYNPLPNFKNDHLFDENEKYVVLLDGVIINKDELEQMYPDSNWMEIVSNIIDDDFDNFMDKFRGCFCGVVVRKSDGKLVCFTNQTGEKTIYYRLDKKSIMVASHIDFMRKITVVDESLSPDIDAHYELLATGSILDDKTPFKGIKRLTAGKRFIWDRERVNLSWYHKFTNIPENELTLDECIEEADKLFRQAVDRIFRKSKAYGYRSECDLSGGLDSRLATWVAHDLGYENFLNVCYCVPGNLDHKISEKIAKDLGNEYYFLPMGAYIMGDIDEKEKLTGGQVLYMLSTGSYYVLDEFKKRNVGLCCTGILGEMSKASWVVTQKHEKPTYIVNRKSTVIPFNAPEQLNKEYDNYEQMALYEYSLKAFALSVLTRQQTVETLSPMMDTDYLDFAFKIPLKYRKGNAFVENYICKKYPEAAKYVWQAIRMPVDKHIQGKKYLPKTLDDLRNTSIRIVNKVLRATHINQQLLRKDEMNPLNYWYIKDKEIKIEMDGYFKENIKLVDDIGLGGALRKTYESPWATDKVQVLNVLSIWKLYFKREL